MYLAIGRAFGCQTIFHLHGGEFQQYTSDEAGLLMRWWIRRTLQKSSRVIALSDSWAAFIARFSPQAKVVVIPNSVRLNPLPVPAQIESGRILFLGRVERKKGIFELLSAFSALKEAFPAARLAIGGDGDLAAAQAYARDLGLADRVEFLGWIGSEQKRNELARASVFALPSYDEGLPMAMLEAMAAAKAIVVTSVGGIPSTVHDGENGLLVPPRDASALADALRKLFADDTLRERLASNARKTIESRFSTEVVIGKLSALYSMLGSNDRA